MSSENGNGTALATAPKREIRVVEDHGPLAYLLDTARFEHMHRIATAMATASLIPDHLECRKGPEEEKAKRTVANCFLVVNQAFRWGLDPFAVMSETYAIGGKLAFQGKLIAAVVNSRAGLAGRLAYKFSGSGDGRTVTVSGTFEGDDEPRTVEVSVAQAKTTNDMWKKDPDQKLIYTGSIKWARRHCPEVVLGVMTDDDCDRMAAAGAGAPQISTRQQLEALCGMPSPVPPGQVELPADEPIQAEAHSTYPTQEAVEQSGEADDSGDPLDAIRKPLHDAKLVGDVLQVEENYKRFFPDREKEIIALCDARRGEIRAKKSDKQGHLV